MILPPGPVPLISKRDSPFDAAKFLARAEAGLRLGSSTSFTEVSRYPSVLRNFSVLRKGSTCDSCFRPICGSCPGRRSSYSSPSAPITAIFVNTGTSSPSSKNRCRTIPSPGDSTSNEALSVSTTQITSPAVTVSPLSFFHSRIMHDSTVIPCLGINTGTAISCLHHPLGRQTA